MNKFAICVSVMGALSFSTSVLAQNITASTPSAAPVAVVPAVVPAATTVPVPVAVVAQPTVSSLKAGTAIKLRTLDALTSKKKKSKVGDRFSLEVSEAVTANGVTIIPVGSQAIGEVTMMKNKGMWGKRGRLSARVVSLRVADRQIRLSGTFDDSGSAGTAGVVGAVIAIPVAGFFVTGTSAEIAAGTIVTGFLDEDIPYSVPAAQ